MSLSIKYLFHESGAKPVIACSRRLWAKCNDLALNVDTINTLSPEKEEPTGSATGARETNLHPKHDDPEPYVTPDYWYVRRLSRLLNPKANDVFYDLGSGKGRILCVMAQKRFKKVVGVELRSDLCEAARRNVSRLRLRRSPIEVLCEDAATADLTDGTVYFLFNPFGRDTLQAVFEKIRLSLGSNPRHVRFVYYNSVHEDILESCSWLTLYYQFQTLTGLRVTLWQNSDPAANTPELQLADTSQSTNHGDT